MAATIRISIVAAARDAIKTLKETGNAADGMGTKLSSGAGKLAGMAAGAVGIGTLIGAFTDGAREAQAFQDAANQTSAALKTNAQLAGLSVTQVQSNSAALENLTGARIDENAATDAQNRLIRAGVATQQGLQNALKASSDVALGTGKDLQSVSTAVSKAMADPTKAQAVLARSGVVLSKAQQDSITAMVKSGDTAGAQAAVIGALEQKYKGASEAAGTGFAADLGRARDALSDSERDITTALLPTLSKAAKAFAEDLPGAIRTLTPVVKGIFAVVSNPAFQVLAGVIATVVVGMKVYAAYTAVVSAATKAWAAIQTVFNVIMALNPVTIIIIAIVALIAIIVLIATKTTWFQDLWKAAMAGMSAAINWIKEAASAVWNWIKTNWPLLLAIVTGPIGLIVLYVVRHWDQIKSATVAAFTAVKNFFVGVWDWIKARFQEGVDGVKAIWHGILSLVDRAIEFRDRLIGAFTGLVDRLLGIGKSIMQGLADGIQAGLQWVKDKIKGLGSLIPDWLKSVLGISSPSKVMAGLGRNITQGLVAGIQSGVPALSRTLGGVSDAITGGLSASPTVDVTGLGRLSRTVGAGADVGGVTYQIINHVAPGADPAEVGRQTIRAIEAYEQRTGRRRLAAA